MTDLNRLAAAKQALLTTTADPLARDCGFVRRQRKVFGSNFAQALVFGALANTMKPIDRYLDILGVRRGVSKEELKTAYRASIQISHPDRFHDNEVLKKKAEEQTKRLNEAYKYLLTHFESISISVPSGDPRFDPGRGTSRPAENPAAKGRDEEEKKRQDAEYQKRKALREVREAQQARRQREQEKRDKQTLILGIVFVVLLFLYAAYARRQANARQRAEVPVESVEVEPE